jgi:hypothetical protein
MIKREFFKEDLLELLDYGKGDKVLLEDQSEAEFISNRLTGNGRWALDYELLFRVDDKVYLANYQRGATEYQETYPFENDGNWVNCIEMEPYEVTVTKYRVKQ